MSEVNRANESISEQLARGGQPDWVIAQNRAFMGWCNTFLWERQIQLTDFTKDFHDGLNLWNLLELISGKKIADIVKLPKFQVQKMENLNKCFKFIAGQGLKVVNIGSEDLFSGNLKIILGLIWTLILRYQIQKGGNDSGSKDALLKWCQEQLEPQGVDVANFNVSWKDGRAFAGLANVLRPKAFGVDAPGTEDAAAQNMQAVFAFCQEQFGIPQLLDPALTARSKPDDLATMTYVSFFRQKFETLPKPIAVPEAASGQLSYPVGVPGELVVSLTRPDGSAVSLAQEVPVQFLSEASAPLTGTARPQADGSVLLTFSPLLVPGKYQTVIQSPEPLLYELYALPAVLAAGANTDSSVLPGAGTRPLKLVDGHGAPVSNTEADLPLSAEIVVGEGVVACVVDQSGPLAVQYPALPPGNYEIAVKVGDVVVTRIPLVIVPAPVTVVGDGLLRARTGVPAHCHVTGAQADVHGHLTGPEALECTVTRNGDVQDVTYVARLPGAYELHLRADDTIGASPYHPQVVAGTEAHGSGLEDALVAQTAHFVVQVNDDEGKVCGHGGHVVQVDGCSPTVVDHTNGTYTVTYVPTTEGPLVLAVSVDGAVVPGSPFHLLVRGDVAPGHCIATGPGITVATAAEPAHFTVTARTAAGALLGRGGASVRAELTGPSSVSATVQDEATGTYACQYTARVAGTYALQVLVNDEPIADSPFSVAVSAGACSGAHSTASGPGLSAATLGQPAPVMVTLRDEADNVVTDKDAHVELELDGATVDPPVAAEGVYNCNYLPTRPGPALLHVRVNGAAIAGSPFSVAVSAAAVSAKHCVATGDGLAHATSGVPAVFTIEARDATGGRVPVGGGIVSATLEDVTVTIRDEGDGLYLAEYVPVRAGSFPMAVRFNGDEIEGSPFQVAVSAGAATDARVEGPGLSGTTLGSPGHVTVTLLDAAGNLCQRGGDRVTFELDGHVGTAVDQNDGSHSLAYEARAVGTFPLAIQLNERALAASPWAVSVRALPPDAKRSTADGLGLQEATALEPAHFVVRLSDSDGRALTTGGARVSARLRGPADLSVEITDASDGTYPAQYTANLSGPYQLEVTVEDVPLPASPYSVLVSAGVASPAHARAAGEGLTDPQVGVTRPIRVTVSDAAGNVLGRGGDTVVGDLDGQPIGATDHGDGTYDLPVCPHVAGPCHVAITLNGTPIEGSPFALDVAVGEASGAQCTAEGEGLSRATRGATAHFRVHTKDLAGNALPRGGARVEAHLAEQGALPVKDNADGTYNVEYCPTVKGLKELAVSVNGHPVVGSPFAVEISAPADATQSKVRDDGPGGFVLQTKDADGEEKKKGGDQVKVLVKRPLELQPRVKDNADGTYRIIYPPTMKPGEYDVAMEINGTPSPSFSLTVPPPEVPEEEQALIRELLPKSSKFLLEVFGELNATKRKKLIEELKTMKK